MRRKLTLLVVFFIPVCFHVCAQQKASLVQILVTYNGGAPLSDVQIKVAPVHSTAQTQIRTNQNGIAHLSLSPGKYIVSLGRHDLLDQKEELEIGEGLPHSVHFTMQVDCAKVICDITVANSYDPIEVTPVDLPTQQEYSAARIEKIPSQRIVNLPAKKLPGKKTHNHSPS